MNTLTQNSMEHASVAQLVRAAQAGQTEAFGTLVTRFERAVFARAMRRLRNFAEAQELSQDVFIKAFEKIGQLRVPEAFGGWLQSITERMAINRAVRCAPVATTEPETMAATCVDYESPLTVVLRAERRVEVRAGMSRLRDLDRQTLEAFYVKGQSLAEMSDDFDAPLGTIKRRLHVARKRLAKEVGELVAV